MLPPDLVLVRHGHSEGNLFSKRSRAGINSDWTEEFANRHSSRWRLTDQGREQALIAGAWIREHLAHLLPFGRHYVSEYVRARETAGLLDLPGAVWFKEFYLRERDYGALDVLPDDERQVRFAESLRRRAMDAFFWTPPEGESLAQLCLRIDRVLYTLHRECTHFPVVIVCHGEVIRAFRVRLERMVQERFAAWEASDDPKERIHNCQVLHYTRRDLVSGEVAPYYSHWRSVCPWDSSLSDPQWQEIVRCRYTNEELLAELEQYPRLVAD
jgi:NAD+ kinase